MIRRRGRKTDESDTDLGPAGDVEGAPAAAEAEAGEAVTGEGPWDSGEDYPRMDRIDFGSLRVPIGPGFEVQVSLTPAEEDGMAHVVGVVVMYEGGALELQAFAAPKRDGIWDDVRREIATGIEQANGKSEHVDGPFGVELRAEFPVEIPDEARSELPPELKDAEYVLQPARFIGVDGPRWLLHAVIKGPAAEDAEQAQPLEDIFQGIVVNRGDQPMPPRDLLPLTLPEEAQEALAAQEGDGDDEGDGGDDGGDDGGRPPLDPFARGPEITEVR